MLPLRYRPLALGLLISTIVALLATVVSLFAISLAPPGIRARPLQISAAATHVLVRVPPSAARRATPYDVESLSKRTALLGQLMASAPVVEKIGREAGIDPRDIAATAPITANVPATLREPNSEQRAYDILTSHRRYRLDVQAKPNLPLLDIYTQAPTPAEASRLATTAVERLGAHLRERPPRSADEAEAPVTLEQIGTPRAGVINPRAGVQIAGMTFIVTFGLTAGGLLLLRSGRRARTRAAPARAALATPAGAWAPVGGQALALVAAPAQLLDRGARTGAGGAARHVERAPVEAATPAVTGAWPRTTRPLPWLLAAFIAVLWLVPFNQIALTVSTPIDLKFDRLVLPFVVAAWIVALAAGGINGPRLYWTRVHTGIALFVVLALLSVVFNAPYLNQTLELDLAIKKLTLLMAYVSLFIVVASVVRRAEIPAFLTYMLCLGVICALGTIWEYRFPYNVFYDLSDKLLPPFFVVGSAESGAVDEIGRRLTRGPAELGLEAVAMLTMALPIALVRILGAKRTRDRALYGLAACVLLAAAIATYRKSAFLAPIAVVATLVYFNRGFIRHLLPVGVMMVIAIPVLSPDALGSIAQQLDPDRLGVATVSDRTSDYDAIRPDLWAHFAIGRGFGTYDHTSYRILDSEILVRVIEMGVLGLAAYLLMGLCVIAGARRLIRHGDPRFAAVAMAAGSVAVAFIVLSTLFDVLAFPHVPYLFLTWAGLLAVALQPGDEAT